MESHADQPHLLQLFIYQAETRYGSTICIQIIQLYVIYLIEPLLFSKPVTQM